METVLRRQPGWLRARTVGHRGAYAVACVMAAVLAGCAVQPIDAEPQAHVAGPAHATAATPAPYVNASAPAGGLMEPHRLAQGDKIKIVVFKEEQLSGDFEIDGAGRLSMPLAGQIVAAGLTQQELEQLITVKLSAGYLRDPKVSVQAVTLRPIYVLGEVKTAGEYPFKTGLSVMSAVALAGGYGYRANTTAVFIKRANENGEREVPATTSVPVYPGDVIRVTERYF